MVRAGLRVQHVGGAQAGDQGVDQAGGIFRAGTGLGEQRASGRRERRGLRHRQPQLHHRGDQREAMDALPQHARQMRQRADRLRQQDVDRRGRRGILGIAPTPAFVLQRQPVALGAQLVGGQPAGQLQQQLLGRGQHPLGAVDAAGQFERHVEAHRRGKPGEAFVRLAIARVERVDQQRTAAPAQAATRQAAQVGQRAAAQPFQPIRARQPGDGLDGQAVEQRGHALGPHRAPDAARRRAAGMHRPGAGQPCRPAPRGARADLRHQPQAARELPHGPAERAMAAEQAQAGVRFQQHGHLVREIQADMRRQGQQRQR